MNENQAENLINRILQYFAENPVKGELVINTHSKILRVGKYIEKNIAVMKNSKINSLQFNSCYSRLQELKAFIEQNKNK